MSKLLDLKDKKILYELDLNCRQSTTQIAKKVGLSVEATHYRIKKLEESAITQYQLITNLATFGIFQFKICIATQHINDDELKEIISEIKTIEEVKWIISAQGPYDIIISCEVHNYSHINNLKHQVLSHFKGHIRESSVSLLSETHAISRNFLVESSPSKSRIIMKETPQVELEELDLQLIKALSKNARQNVVDLAAELNSTTRIISYRIKQLEKKGIIQGYKIAINYENAQIKFYKLFITLSQPTQKELARLQTTLENHPNCTHTVTVVGNWDLEPEFEVFSEKEMEHILTNIRNQFSNIISRVDIVTVKEEHKFVYY